MTRVFVYGTLMRDCANHAALRSSVFIGEAVTPPVYSMVSLGGYPGVLKDGGTSIAGEVYEVGHATLATLDRIEGHPRFYERQEIELFDGTKADAYLLPDAFRSREPIPSGSWRAFLAALQLEEDNGFEDEEDEDLEGAAL